MQSFLKSWPNCRQWLCHSTWTGDTCQVPSSWSGVWQTTIHWRTPRGWRVQSSRMSRPAARPSCFSHGYKNLLWFALVWDSQAKFFLALRSVLYLITACKWWEVGVHDCELVSSFWMLITVNRKVYRFANTQTLDSLHCFERSFYSYLLYCLEKP